MEMEFEYSKGDAVYGTVTSRCKKGVFVTLPNGERGFCYGAGNVPVNARIICSIKKNSTDLYLMQLDNVCSVLEVA